MKRVLTCFVFLTLSIATAHGQTAPSVYSAYTGTDTKQIPPAPALGPTNSVITDPTFGSLILRVTDANTNGGESFISIDAGNFRAWNANSTAIKLTGPRGDGYWLEFNPNTMKVGDGSSRPAIHSLSFGARWEWSTVDPDIIYFLNGNQIGSYNKSTGVTRNLGGPPNGDPVAYFPTVVGQDNWVCAAAGAGVQDSYTKIFCVNPLNSGTSKFIDVLNKTIDGVPQPDPWPMSGSGQTIGIHELSGGTGSSWLEVTFHGQSWGANGGSVFDISTNTWSFVTNADPYWSGHFAMGNGKYVNASGSVDGRDSRGMITRSPDNLMSSANYLFVEQPPNTLNQWCDSEHSSWLNSMNNPNAPLLVSRFTVVQPCQFAWSGEIIAAAVDGSNTVWRFAHNHSTGSCYYGEGFAQISNDGKWALFSSYWDGQLGSDTSFGCSNRIDTFIVQLGQPPVSPPPVSPPPTITTTSLPDAVENNPYSAAVSATGGTGPYTWSIVAGGLPNGLVLSPSSGIISGTPSGISVASALTIQVSDAASRTATANLSIVMRSGSRVNVALASNGATAIASSTYNYTYPATATIDGDRRGINLGNGGVWEDGSWGTFPDWLEVDFNGVKTVDEIDVFSVQDNFTSPADPTPSMTFTSYGVRNFEVQYWTGTAWQDVAGGVVTNNNSVWRQLLVGSITTTKIRVWITDAAYGHSRLTEVEAWSSTTVSTIASRTNVALATNGTTAIASSTYNPTFYPASATIDGDRSGINLSNGGVWEDGDWNGFPDWLELDFNSVKTLDEIDVFSVQDNAQTPVAPTPSMTFSLYGVRDFDVQYWTGTAWQDVPGGVVRSNNLVWRQLSVGAITTTKIRVYITDAAYGHSRLTEVEAWGSN